MNDVKIKFYSVTVDCKEPYALAKFYAALLQWEIVFQNEEVTCIGAPGTNNGTYPCITFQKNSDYLPPVWPEEPSAQQQMEHMDFAVTDLEKAVEYAVQCGAAVAEKQFSDDWRVLFDPAGHPFCLCRMEPLFESPHFGLL